MKPKIEQVRTNREARCPACKSKLDGATGTEAGATPKPGDLSVCCYCTVVLEFNTDLTVRQAPQSVLDSLSIEESTKLQLARWAIGKYNRGKGEA